MLCVWCILLALPSGLGIMDSLEEVEIEKIKAAVPQEVLKVLTALKDEDKDLLFKLASRPDFFTAIFTENERLNELASMVLRVFGMKIAHLPENAKKFVLETIDHLKRLHGKAVRGMELKMEQLAEREQKRFASLSQEDRAAIEKEFPALTHIGIFTNKKLQYIVKSLSENARKASTGRIEEDL